MTWFDHGLAVVLAAAMPVESWHAFRRLIAAVRAGDRDARTRAYRHTIALQWTMVATLSIAWVYLSRPWSALGIGLGTLPGALAGAVGAALGLLLLLAQQRTIAALSDDRLDRLRTGLGDVVELLPSTAQERQWFRATAVTAGICEEVLYRGFLIWYLGHAVSPALTIAASSVVFGAGHIYQGVSGVIKTSVIGLVMAAIYVWSGTLWAPMLIHASVDLGAGAIARRLAR